MARVKPTRAQVRRLLAANANRCCVCKARDVGLSLHHIDEDNSNTIDSNLAVLCAGDHDRYHRPDAYNEKEFPGVRKIRTIADHKATWEEFVAAAKQPNSYLVATVSGYGSLESIHSAQIVYHWPDETIVHVENYHTLDQSYDQITTEIVRSIGSIGPHICMSIVDEPFPVEHCPCCGRGYSRTTRPEIIAKAFDSSWDQKSVLSIYVNPCKPSLAIALGCSERSLSAGSIHRCGRDVIAINVHGYEENLRISDHRSVRSQVRSIISRFKQEWAPAVVLIGTGPHENPFIVKKLDLPACWEIGDRRGERKVRATD